MPEPRSVRVTWLDSGMHIDHGWAPRQAYLNGADLNQMRVLTVGMLMHEDDDTVLIGLNHDPAHDAWVGVQLIARENIISMEDLCVSTSPVR